MKGLTRLVLALIFTGSLIFSIIWLWQRQPKAPKDAIKSITNVVTGKNDSQDQNTQTPFSLNIPDSKVLDSAKINVNGKASANSLILIYSNSHDYQAAVSPQGEFDVDLDLDKNLNLINFVELDKDFKEIQAHIFTFYLQDKDAQKKTGLIYAGTVKNIFNNLITVLTANGDKKVKTESVTQLNFPKSNLKPSPKTTDQPDKSDIRVGDYIIALGNTSSQSELKASIIDIVRENKPDIVKKYAAGIILSPVKSKIFSAKNIKDSGLLEFKLDKNSQVFQDSKKADEKAISKDKKAICFYNASKENLITSIYLLP